MTSPSVTDVLGVSGASLGALLCKCQLLFQRLFVLSSSLMLKILCSKMNFHHVLAHEQDVLLLWQRGMGDITIPETVAPEIVLYCVMQMRTPLIAEAMHASSSVLTKHEFVKHFLTHATMTMPSCMLHPLTHLFSILFILLSVCFHCTRDPKAAQGNLDTSYAFCVEANVGGCIPS